MTINYTTLLGLAQPVPGTEANTWGTVVNDSITELVEDAIAGSATASVTSGDWTLTTTGSGAANQARSAILIPTGTPGVSRNIIAPSSSKAYIVDNQSNAAVVVKGSATTGVSIAAGTAALVAWDGTDFVLVAQDLANASGTLPVTKGGTGATTLTGVLKGNGTSAVTASNVNLASEVTGTLPVANGGTGATTLTANNVILGNGTSAVQVVAPGTTGNVLTSNGTTWASTALPNVGDVDGPGSSTDNAVARFDGTTGKIIQNSAVTIDDDGNTVISTNSTTNALRITQVGTGNALLVEDSANPDASPFVVTADGRVISGGLTAYSISSVAPKYQAQTTSVFDGGFGGFSWENSNQAQISVWGKSRSGIIGTQAIVQSGDALASFRFAGSDGTAFIEAAQIQAYVDGTPGTNDMPGRVVISTTPDGGSSPLERVRVDNAGRVGIGGTPSAGNNFPNLYIAKNITGTSNTYAINIQASGQSDVTGVLAGVVTQIGTAASNYNIAALTHFSANQGTLSNVSSGGAITNQYGFNAGNSITGATNNYGFYSNIPAFTGRWNFYAAGTAANFFAGSTAIGSTLVTERLNLYADSRVAIRLTNTTGAPAGLNDAYVEKDASNNLQLISSGGATNSNILFLTGSSAERMRIFASGGVSIGNTTDPGATNLSVTGTISGGTVTGTVDGTNAIGFRTIPQNSQSTAYTLVLADSGKHILHPSADTTARTFTIPANSSVAYPIGTAITFINQNGAGVVTIAITTDTMRLSPAGTTGSRTLAANGSATCIKITSTEWIISGSGLT